ncbi:hypothetical protein IV203_038484 [Nitzschia inconspicua]|uniref:Uncharacterized protein n=1 Tax=Nitzschia inconspicua TaxID=303405 RepID=A0A9K3LRI3_9STRA|nr:hypothetical protein IV203_038484 [Nitzschia inconspicua]
MVQTREQKSKPLPSLTSGMPPWHSTFFVGALAAITLTHLPSLESLDQMATLDQFTHRVFPNLLTLRGLALIRLSIAAIAISLTIYLILGDGWYVYANYKSASKLRRDYFIRLKGLGTLCPFTSWCWFFLGQAFLLNGWIAMAVDLGMEDTIQPWMMRTALVLSEISFPFALLVSTAVKYAIWPAVLAGGKPHNLAGFRNQMQHNCNSIFALTEVALLGGISVDFRHLSLATMVGIAYILFTWMMAVIYYGNQEVGPQYLYWFQDTTLGETTTFALLALLVALTTFFGVFAGIEMLIETIGGTFLTKLVFVVAVSAFVCKFR